MTDFWQYVIATSIMPIGAVLLGLALLWLTRDDGRHQPGK